MSSQLSAHAITAHTAMTRISVSRCSTLPAHRGSARAEKCSTSFSTDIAILPSSIKGEPAARQSVRTCQTFSCVAPAYYKPGFPRSAAHPGTFVDRIVSTTTCEQDQEADGPV